MRVYIKSIGSISPQEIDEDLGSLRQPEANEKRAVTCKEPDYSRWIEVQRLRRMSRVLKMGTTSALMAMGDGKVKPEAIHAIIAGTGYGCLKDTEGFLTRMIQQGEQMLNPTPFMQSTHNTIGAQTAMLLQCQGYNQTHVQGAFSFEHALLDTMMYLDERPEEHVLLMGVDEWTEVSHTIHRRFGKFRDTSPDEGSPAGEGATSFVITGIADSIHAMASVESLRIFYKPDTGRMIQEIVSFLTQNDMATDDIDLLLLGSDDESSERNKLAIQKAFSVSSIGYFKHLGGEYSTASAFATALAAMILRNNRVPEVVFGRDNRRTPETILIYNVYFRSHHSLILLKSCRHTTN